MMKADFKPGDIVRYYSNGFRHGRVAQVLCDRVYVVPQDHGLRQEVLVRTVLKIAAARG